MRDRLLVAKSEGKRQFGKKICVDGRIILKWIFMKLDWEAWTELVWLGIGRGGVLLCIRRGTFDFIKWGGFGIYWVAEDLFASPEGLCYVNLVNYLNLKKTVITRERFFFNKPILHNNERNWKLNLECTVCVFLFQKKICHVITGDMCFFSP